MAVNLTPDQERTLVEMLDAFESGKRVADLPMLPEGTDPFAVTSEVAMEDGTSRRANPAQLMPIVSMTEDEYEALQSSGKLDGRVYYMIVEDDSEG